GRGRRRAGRSRLRARPIRGRGSGPRDRPAPRGTTPPIVPWGSGRCSPCSVPAPPPAPPRRPRGCGKVVPGTGSLRWVVGTMLAAGVRRFATSALRRSHYEEGPGKNLPFSVENKWRLLVLMCGFFGSGFVAPFLIVRHQLLKK
uniref:Cytochrome c oxidase subunit 7C, mitochondrial n=1 Tax=Strix occidentalis caurina TaxID=311401 RepID=A0A8D0FLC8_STROC